MLGQGVDLSGFLFGVERAGLERYRPLLRDLQQNACFYCHEPLRGEGAVDHFVPWARYPVDLGHNFVLAPPTCNGRKSDHLAAEPHLAAWQERNDRYGQAMGDWFGQAHAPHDLGQSTSITRWAYTQAASTDGLVWVRAGELQRLGPGWDNACAKSRAVEQKGRTGATNRNLTAGTLNPIDNRLPPGDRPLQVLPGGRFKLG